MRENLVQFSSKQENQSRIITFVNNQYQNYQVSLIFFCHIIATAIITIPVQWHWGRNNKRCSNRFSETPEQKHFDNIFFLVRTISKLTLFVPLLTKYNPTNGLVQITSEIF